MQRIPINWLTNLPLVLPGPQVQTQVPWRSSKFLKPIFEGGPMMPLQDVRKIGKGLYGLEDYVDGMSGNVDWV